MFRAILALQWKWARLVVVAATLFGFAIPLLAVQGATDASGDPRTVNQLLDYVQSMGVFFPLLAAAAGLLIAVSAWAADHAGRHVYALSLPLPRWQFVLYRYGAGTLLLLGPVLGVWIGSLVAVAGAAIPAGLHPYPHLVTLRFVLCVLVAYSCFFAISAGTSRTAGYVLVGLLSLVIVQLIFGAMNVDLNLLGWFTDSLFIWPGPLEIYTGRWSLIDV